MGLLINASCSSAGAERSLAFFILFFCAFADRFGCCGKEHGG
jgi:hypothetical protein